MVEVAVRIITTGTDERRTDAQVRTADRGVGGGTAWGLRWLFFSFAEQAVNVIGIDHLHAALGAVNVVAEEVLANLEYQINQRRTDADQFRRGRNWRG